MDYIIHLRKKVSIIRLWHYKLLPYLPKLQLISQKREVDLIWKDIANGKKTNHILINYIWDYQDYLKELSIYYRLLKDEFDKRRFKFNAKNHRFRWFTEYYVKSYKPFKNHHNDRYLLQCFYNLQEKYDRGQKDFDNETFRNLVMFVDNELNYNCDLLLNLKEK